MSSITTSAIDTPTRRSVERTCDDLALLVLAVVGLIASLTFRDYGLGWDDYTHAEYADLLLRMYGSGFKDTGALSFANLYMYGGGFDMAAALLHKVIPLELFETRRLLGAVVGVIGLAVTWRLGRRVGGPLAGLAALLLLALCPIFYGHMFMNPKDAPFAVAMVILMLGLVRLADEYPSPSPRTILIVGPGAGLSIGSRILGGLALVYALIGFLPLLLEEAHTHSVREAGHRFLHVVYVLLPALVLGYLVMGLIFGRLYQRWGRVGPLVVAHALIDAVAFVGYAYLAGRVRGLKARAVEHFLALLREYASRAQFIVGTSDSGAWTFAQAVRTARNAERPATPIVSSPPNSTTASIDLRPCLSQ